MKILILKPSSLGDVIQALPVLRLLKKQDPSREVYWWISADLAELIEGDPDLSGVHRFQRKRWRNPRYWGEFFQSIRELRRRHFDWVIDLQGLARSSLVCWLSRGEFAVGVEDWREGAPGLYDLVVPRPSANTHAIDWYLEVLKALDVPVHWDFTWMPERPGVAEEVRRRWKPGRNRWIGIIPGARWANKRWPVEEYAETLRALAGTRPDLRFVILGASSDADLGRTILKSCPERCLDLTGRTSLPEMVEWIRLSELVLSNDTGPMHIAAALGKPVVAIFGPTNPARTGPYGQIQNVLRATVPCAPCLSSRCHWEKPLECLRAIRPAEVSLRIQQLLP